MTPPPRPLPQDPAVVTLIRAARQTQFSRRRLLSSALGLGGAAALAACAPPKPPAGGAETLTLPVDRSATEKIVRWANWTAYLDMDEAGKTYPTLAAFQKKYGIKVSYTEDVDDNDTYYNKVAPQLRAGQDIQRDIFVFTDWMASRVIREQLCQPLELIEMSNAANLLEPLKNVGFDPGRNHSLTWQSGFGGIGYNRKKVGREIKSLDDLWKPDLKGKIVVLSEYRDTVGLTMMQQGVDISKSFTKDQFTKATDFISQKIADGYIRRVKGNSYLEDLKSGNAVAGIVWSGDLSVLRTESNDPNWQFVIPETGGTLWSDNMLVPITSTHRRNAEKVMNYYYDPKVAAQVAAWVNYVCPVQGAQEEMAKTDPKAAQNPLVFPSTEWIAQKKIKSFRALTPQEESEYGQLWQKVVGD